MESFFNINYRFIELAKLTEDNPVFMVFWSAFGVPLVVFVVGMILIVLRKLHLRKAFEIDTMLLLVSLSTITWIMGFITQIIMFFTQVSGLRMLIIWIVMLICYTGFLLFNRKMVLKWAKANSPFDEE